LINEKLKDFPNLLATAGSDSVFQTRQTCKNVKPHTWTWAPKLGQAIDMGILLTFSLRFDPPHANKKGLSLQNDTVNTAP
jgi:hypothetical protein